MVVAPIHLKSPLASAGLSRLAASMPASSPAPPAPISMCSSSMKRMMRGSAATSSSSPLRRSSNSPRYFVSATNRPSCSDTTRLPCRLAGTSPATMRCARPSTTAVLPTPGSPSRQGLLFRRRTRMRIMRSSSCLRPIMGSSFPSLASSVRSTPHCLRILRLAARLRPAPAPTLAPLLLLLSEAAAAPPRSSSSTTSISTSMSCWMMLKALQVGEPIMARATSRRVTVSVVSLAAIRRMPLSSSPSWRSSGPEVEPPAPVSIPQPVFPALSEGEA
mmetsp:Transcript_27363/g.77219  ORF Transcript_27363/g.77219 Transcript_27363/m.77219 type:complete len:275 (+) Transcript_27363:872-1696(+)